MKVICHKTLMMIGKRLEYVLERAPSSSIFELLVFPFKAQRPKVHNRPKSIHTDLYINVHVLINYIVPSDEGWDMYQIVTLWS